MMCLEHIRLTLDKSERLAHNRENEVGCDHRGARFTRFLTDNWERESGSCKNGDSKLIQLVPLSELSGSSTTLFSLAYLR